MGARAMVRTGLALYGDALPLEGAAEAGQLRPRLKPVLTWKTRVVGLREVAAGTTAGYGATFIAKQPMRLALLPVGYADGFRREASSGLGDGWVFVGGLRAAVVGRVSMNLTVVDATALKTKSLWGMRWSCWARASQAADHARWCGTIPYEILCGIRAHVHLQRKHPRHAATVNWNDAVKALREVDVCVGVRSHDAGTRTGSSVRWSGDLSTSRTLAARKRRRR